MKQCIPSAADLLLKNYIRLAQEATNAATPQVSTVAGIEKHTYLGLQCSRRMDCFHHQQRHSSQFGRCKSRDINPVCVDTQTLAAGSRHVDKAVQAVGQSPAWPSAASSARSQSTSAWSAVCFHCRGSSWRF